MAPISISDILSPRTTFSPGDIINSLSKRFPAPSSHISSRLLQFTKRQSNNAIIPTTYGSIDSGPAPGAVVGIVLGSVGGFLLVLWLIYTCAQFGNTSSSSSYTESVVVRDRRKSHGSTRSRRSETIEVRRERSPIRIVRPPPERVERVIVEETRETRTRERSISGSDDEVVVIEEHSPPRRSKSKREKEERRESGYRTVDPHSYGGVVGGRKERRGSGR